VKTITFPTVVLSFFQVAEVDFSFLVEAELDAARAESVVLGPALALAWLLASVEEERVCFEAALAADVPVAELVADVAAEELVASAAVAVLAADALAAELVAGAAAAVLVAAAAVAVLVANALAAELVAGAAAAELEPAYFEAEVSAADALVAGPVVDVGAEPERACSELVAALPV